MIATPKEWLLGVCSVFCCRSDVTVCGAILDLLELAFGEECSFCDL